MAEAVVLVCDECGKPDATSITIRAGGRNYTKDLCAEHLRALLKDTRTPRRGRKRKVATAPSATVGRKRQTAKVAKKRAGSRKKRSAARKGASRKPS